MNHQHDRSTGGERDPYHRGEVTTLKLCMYMYIYVVLKLSKPWVKQVK